MHSRTSPGCADGSHAVIRRDFRRSVPVRSSTSLPARGRIGVSISVVVSKSAIMPARHAACLAVVVALCSGCGGSDSSPSPLAPTATIPSTQTVASLSVSLSAGQLNVGRMVALTSSAATLNVGGTATLTATAAYGDGTSANVSATWGSSNSSVATVSAAGIVTAHAVGTATITGTFGALSGAVGTHGDRPDGDEHSR